MKKCLECNKNFDPGPYRSMVRYCSLRCRLEHIQVPDNSASSTSLNGSKCTTINLSTTKKGGYKELRINRKSYPAHRVYYSEYVGPIPDDKPVVRHLCNNPACVNVKHLDVGTSKDNSNDMLLSKRQASGEKCARSKLKEPQIKEIRSSTELSNRELAEKYNVSMNTIRRVKSNTTWKHVE